MRHALSALLTLFVALVAPPALAGYLTVYGGPTWSRPGGGGISGIIVADVNNNGTAVGYAYKYASSGASLGPRAVRWDGSGAAAVELLGAAVPIYLLAQPAGSPGAAGQPRDYARHWTPVHLDVVVADLDAALARALAAGLRTDEPDPATGGATIRQAAWGRLARLADPFGHGWCLIQFSAAGYDAIASPAPADD